MEKIISFLMVLLYTLPLLNAQCEKFRVQYLNPANQLKEKDPSGGLELVNQFIYRFDNARGIDTCDALLATAHQLKSILLRNLHKFDQAVLELDKAIVIRRRQKNERGLALLKDSRAITEKMRGDYLLAIEFANQAILEMKRLISKEPDVKKT